MSLSRTDEKQVREIARAELKAFFTSTEGMACLAIALESLFGAARNGAVVQTPDGQEAVIPPPEKAEGAVQDQEPEAPKA
jgi:hypothetical protein